MLLEKLRYLTQGAELVVFAGSLPRDVADDFYAEAIRELDAAPHPGRARLRGRAAAARRRGGAVPRLAEPARGGGARRPGVPRRRGLPARARPASPSMGARNVLITTEDGCVALLREEREARRFRARRAAGRAGLDRRLRRRAARGVPRRAPRRPRRTRSRCARRSPRAPPRRSRSAPGSFDPRQAGRLQAGVERQRARARRRAVAPELPSAAAGTIPGWTSRNSRFDAFGSRRCRRSSRRKG